MPYKKPPMTPKAASRQRATQRAQARTRETLRTPKPVSEAGTWQNAAVRIAGSAVKALSKARATSPRIVKFAEDAPAPRAASKVEPKVVRANKAAVRKTRAQSAAAKSYATKDPVRVAAAKKAAETRAANMDAALRAAKSKGRRQGAVAVGGVAAAAAGVKALEKPKKGK